jgi:hypothetical protein
MRAKENSGEIVLRYVPVRAFMISGGLVLIGGILFLWMLYPLFSGASILARLLSGSLIDFISPVIFGAIFTVTIYWFVRIPVVTVTISDRTKSVDAHFRRIMGSETNRYYFTQIVHAKSYKNAIDSETYHLALMLANFKEVQLKAVTGKDRQEAAKRIKKINKLIRPPKPPPQTGGRKQNNADRTKRK